MEIIKKIIRLIISFILNEFYYLFLNKRYSVTREGIPLKKGITAVISAKNEEYLIGFCLKSLIGVADQIVCIDNGSDDNTFKIMQEFKEKYNSQIEIDIIYLPEALLGDCREAGLNATRYSWHLRWDADMICKTSGYENMIDLRNKVLKNDRPRVIQLPRTNIYGDLHHTSKVGKVVDDGEPILVSFSKYIRYVEYGKFDTIRVPFFYKFTKEHKRYYYHCTSLKSDERLIYRNCYFDWREMYNRADNNLKLKINNLDDYKFFWEKELFDTNNRNSLKFRYQRQMAEIHYVKFNSEINGEYPKVLIDEIEKGQERFKIIYKDNKPYLRIDEEDKEMHNYQPIEEDLNWDIEKYINKCINIKEISDKYIKLKNK